MAKHERDFEAAGKARLTQSEAQLLRGARGQPAPEPTREDALACFLSAAEGWDEAARRLDGAFADCPALRKTKD